VGGFRPRPDLVADPFLVAGDGKTSRLARSTSSASSRDLGATTRGLLITPERSTGHRDGYRVDERGNERDHGPRSNGDRSWQRHPVKHPFGDGSQRTTACYDVVVDHRSRM
jgi:hypothetical protein